MCCNRRVKRRNQLLLISHSILLFSALCFIFRRKRKLRKYSPCDRYGWASCEVCWFLFIVLRATHDDAWTMSIHQDSRTLQSVKWAVDNILATLVANSQCCSTVESNSSERELKSVLFIYRGKTYIAKKLSRYLNWIGINTRGLLAFVLLCFFCYILTCSFVWDSFQSRWISSQCDYRLPKSWLLSSRQRRSDDDPNELCEACVRGCHAVAGDGRRWSSCKCFWLHSLRLSVDNFILY